MASLSGPHYKEPDLFPVFLGLLAFVFVFAIIVIIASSSKSHNEYVEAQKKAYHECVQKTNDYEWCFIQFDPELE